MAFKKPPQPPPLFTATKDSLVKRAQELCDANRKLLDKIASEITPQSATFDNVIRPIVEAENVDAQEDRLIGFYQAVSTDSELRDASSKAEQLMEDYGIESAMRDDIFALVDAVYSKNEQLDPESQRLLEKSRKGYISYGLGIPKGPKRDRFKDIKKRLSQLQITFGKNLNEANGAVWLTPEELTGVPDKVVEGFEKGTGENKGKLRMSFKYPDYFPTMKYAQDGSVREKILVAHDNSIPENVALFKEAIVLRDEAARLLGYPDHATFRLEDKMAKTTNTVNDFLADLKAKLLPGSKTEMDHLTQLKKEDLEARGKASDFDGNYYLWDHRFYDRMMIDKEYAVDEQEIAKYFPLQHTIGKMFQIFEELFGLEFAEVTSDDRADLVGSDHRDGAIWHEDAKLFAVWNDHREGGEFVGYLYLDLHPRVGKYGHAANFGLQPGFLFPNGTRHYPSTALVCNFSKPTKDKPSLLDHQEVVTLFHELGHGIHDLVARTKYARFHGTATVRDFVEAPSQMLENWCWALPQLKLLTKHYETGATIPDELARKLISTKHVNGAMFNLRQLHFGIYDMTIHTPKTHKEVEGMDFSALYNDLRLETTALKGPEAHGQKSDWGSGQATFGHLMGGYDAGYYGYLSSLVYSMDMFYTVFKENPMNAHEGRRYRHVVLEKGGSQDEMKTLEEFLGRKPNTTAFFRELGIKA